MKLTLLFWKFYCDITTYAVVFSLIIAVIFGRLVYGAFAFTLMGTIIGLFAWIYFRKHQIIMYRNLGYNIYYLTLRIIFLNAILGSLLLAILSIVLG